VWRFSLRLSCGCAVGSLIAAKYILNLCACCCCRYLVREARAQYGPIDIIDRCNLTVLCEPGQEDTAEFLAQHKVRGAMVCGVLHVLTQFTLHTCLKHVLVYGGRSGVCGMGVHVAG
jgi:hypothetical protein